jgi:hypothetical protein
MRVFALIILSLGFLVSCGGADGIISENPNSAYFYPWDTIPKIYLYRDVANGLDEQFHRVFSISDSEGDHIVVEIYTSDGRIIEALNYNMDSLDLIDHMIVDRNGSKAKAELFKHKMIPMGSEEVWFASRFSGFLDSTLILKEIKRKVKKVEPNYKVMDETMEALIMKDHIRMTNFNPFTQKEFVTEGDALSYFAKGYGLTEWHTLNKKAHYRLEKILSQEDWIKIISR